MCCNCGGGITEGGLSCSNIDPDIIWGNFQFDCNDYNADPLICPADCLLADENDFNSLLACVSCCACGGGTDLFDDFSPACEQSETWHDR